MGLPDLSQFNRDNWDTVRMKIVVEALAYQGALLQRQLHPDKAQMIDAMLAMAEQNLDLAIAGYVQKRQAELDAVEGGG